MIQFNPFWVNVVMWLAWAGYWFVAASRVQATKSSEGILMRLTHLVPLALGFYLIFHDPDSKIIYGRLYYNHAVAWLGDGITAAGLLFSLWGRIHLGRYWSGIITLKEGHKLIHTGPYRFVRHPLYTGFLTAVLGSAIMAGTGDAFLGFAIMLVAYLVKLRREEVLLTTQFGDEYRQFQREVFALVPFVY
jgi:protein-S-isoprenylcysteine O-methyltransferase Ste14